MVVSLTPRRAAGAIFALIVFGAVLFAAGDRLGPTNYARGFAAGRDSYIAGARDEIQAARLAPPSVDLDGGVLSSSPPARSVDVTTREGPADTPSQRWLPSWIRGHTYIVAQEFQPDRYEDAEKARAFLASRGIDTALVRYPSGAIQLITTTGFNLQDPDQRKMADALLTAVHEAGAEFFAGGGGYHLQGYFKTLKYDSW